jgi:mono/diheme cytochrome c family protein
VSFGLLRKGFRPVALAVPLLLGMAWLSGCEDTYSDAIQYTVRNDPLVMETIKGEQIEPDRPGQFPLYSILDTHDERNPLHAKAAELQKTGGLRDPGKLSDGERRKLEQVLGSLFGTPSEPHVLGISKEASDTLKLDGTALTNGSRLYRLHCLQCHGVTGDGRGPTAKWVNPHPRDYRQGLFKFQSVDQTQKSDRKPRREDLIRVVHNGVEGTAMPAHNLLPHHELEDIVSYVIHLSIRGEAEYVTLANAFTADMKLDKESAPKGAQVYLRERVRQIGQRWLDSQTPSSLITPAPYPEKYASDPEARAESAKRGQKLFLAAGSGAQGGCVSCHKDYGRESLFRYDAWGTLVRPANLTAGVFRGGRRPVDLYWRIHSGINGSGMAQFGKDLQGDQIWDLVNFLQAIPYPAMRQRFDLEID